jgi:hypothetical protein
MMQTHLAFAHHDIVRRIDLHLRCQTLRSEGCSDWDDRRAARDRVDAIAAPRANSRSQR